jgi:hypothetical protein
VFKALLIEKTGDGPHTHPAELDDVGLPEGSVSVDVAYSSLNYNDARAPSLEQFLPAFTHTIWYFAKAKNPLLSRSASPTAITRNTEFKFKGHKLACPR